MLQKLKSKVNQFSRLCASYQQSQQRLESELKQLHATANSQKEAIAESQNQLMDIYALSMMRSLTNDGGYLPFTSSSLKPHSLTLALNEIIINHRTQLIEFGSGVSTVIIARLIKANRLKAHLYSVEENEDWIRILHILLEAEGLTPYVTSIHAPLTKSTLALENNTWYSEERLKQLLPAEMRFDFILVDGPSAWRPEIELSRYPAMAFLQGRLEDHFAFFLDDANRNGEQQVLRMWQEKFPYSFSMANSSLAVARRGNWYNINL